MLVWINVHPCVRLISCVGLVRSEIIANPDRSTRTDPQMQPGRPEPICKCRRFGLNRPQMRIARPEPIRKCGRFGPNRPKPLPETICRCGRPGPYRSTNAVGSARTDRKPGSPDPNRSTDAAGPARTNLQMWSFRCEPTAIPDCTA